MGGETVSASEHTQSGNDHFLAYIPSWWKDQPSLVRLGGALHTHFTISTITYEDVVYAPADILPHFLYSTSLCNLWSQDCSIGDCSHESLYKYPSRSTTIVFYHRLTQDATMFSCTMRYWDPFINAILLFVIKGWIKRLKSMQKQEGTKWYKVH